MGLTMENLNHKLGRRELLRGAGVLAAGAATIKLGQAQEAAPLAVTATKPVTNGNLKQSVCKWCFPKISLEEMAQQAQRMGLVGIDLLSPGDFPTLKKYGLVCTMANGVNKNGLGGITKAWNRIEHHDTLVQAYEEHIPVVAAAGFKNIICFSGNRAGLDDETGMKNCAEGLKRIMKVAEENKITLCMELLNSKVNHPDYQCDHTEWGVGVAKLVGSPSFKLLYDIYHMQIMEGDVIATIKKHKDYIGHYHTAGVPGRNEIDADSQELSYPPIIRAILETGYQGYLAHEFLPKKDPITSLAQAARICDL
jgi:hydroxypyruvate isomerase